MPKGDRAYPLPEQPRRLRERNFAAEDVPPQARAIWPALNTQVAIIGALIHNQVIDPATGQTWRGQQMESLTPTAFAQGITMAQEEADDMSRPEGDEYLQHANQADEQANHACAVMEDVEKICSDLVEFPPGSRCSGQEAIAQHQADRGLAGQRERDGNSRHRQRPIEWMWIVLATVVLAALDVMLLWSPLFNLGSLNSAGALYRWVFAFALAALQAFGMELVIRKYRDHERDATERRDAVRDCIRAAQHGPVRSDRVAVAPAPLATEIDTADRELRVAYRWLLLTATAFGIIGVVRVAFLSRGSGQSLAEATLFGAFVGVMLGALVLRLGEVASRGNRLGDRLQAGAAVVADIECRVQEGERRVGAYRDATRLELTTAESARARAADTQQWVIGQYQQALLLAASWLGVTKLPAEHSELIVPRKLDVCDTATHQVQVVIGKLAVVDHWLANPQYTASLAKGAPGAVLEPTAGPPAEATRPIFDGPAPGQPGGLVRVGYQIPPVPTESPWLLIALAAAAVAIALAAALIAPTPENATPPVALTSATLK